VACVDSSRRLDHSFELRLRSSFYFGQVISENEKSQTDGYVVLVTTAREDKVDTASKDARNILLHTFPTKLKAFHVIRYMPKWTNNCLAQAFIGGMVRIYGHLLQGCQTYFHASEDKDEIIQSLESHGISRSGLPLHVGGSWSYERFSHWLTERAQMDREWHPSTTYRRL
jgi:hypothetical protein